MVSSIAIKFFLTLILCLHTVNGFQVLLFNISDSIYQKFLCDIDHLNRVVRFEYFIMIIVCKGLNYYVQSIYVTLTCTTLRVKLCYIIAERFFFILSCFVGYILSFGLVRLSARVGAHIQRRCSRSHGEDVTITDVIIKTPDRK